MSGKMMQMMSSIGHGTAKAAERMFYRIFAPKGDADEAVVNMVRTRKQPEVHSKSRGFAKKVRTAKNDTHEKHDFIS